MRFILLVLLTGCLTGAVVLPQEEGNVDVVFCDRVNCENVLREYINHSSQLSCAQYHVEEELAGLIMQKGALVVEGDHPITGASVEKGSALMHNKFCVFDGRRVWTGSWNPSQGMSIPNNVVVIESKALAAAYQTEFDELTGGTFHGGKKGSAQVLFNGNLTEAYFCPEDNCKEQVLRILESAQESIKFMTFSFTEDSIGKLIEKKAKAGVRVQGLFDPQKDRKYSEFERLKEWSRVAKLHHKVFIVDGKAVITGSYNPTRNGDERNDENILVVREANVVKAFEGEFKRLWNEAT